MFYFNLTSLENRATHQSSSADWPEVPIQTFNTPSGNDFQPRKREFQRSLVETTLDPRALTFDLQQVETVS